MSAGSRHCQAPATESAVRDLLPRSVPTSANLDGFDRADQDVAATEAGPSLDHETAPSLILDRIPNPVEGFHVGLPAKVIAEVIAEDSATLIGIVPAAKGVAARV